MSPHDPPPKPPARQTSQLGRGGTNPFGPPRPPASGTAPAPGGYVEATGLAHQAERRQTLETMGRACTVLGKRMELLHRACVDAGTGVPGVAPFPYQHPLTASSGDTLDYLVELFGAEARWSRAVQVAVFRWDDARKDVAKADAIDPPIAQLRLKLYHLHNLHVDFADEAVLRQLFPPPPTQAVQTPAGAPQRAAVTGPIQRIDPLGSPDRAAFSKPTSPAAGTSGIGLPGADPRAADRKLALTQALLDRLAPGMALVDLVIAMVDRTRPFAVTELLQPAPRLARMVALGLAAEPAATLDQLREARKAHDALAAALATARRTGDVGGLDQLAFPLSGLSQTLAGHPLLKELFPPDYKRLFPQGLPRGGGGGGLGLAA